MYYSDRYLSNSGAQCLEQIGGQPLVMADDMAWKETLRKVDEQLSRYVVLEMIAIRISAEPIVESNHKRLGAIALQKQ